LIAVYQLVSVGLGLYCSVFEIPGA
jgi:hypothetical protein